MDSIKEWSEDVGEMMRLQSEITGFVLKALLEKHIPPEIMRESNSTPMTLANAIRQTIISELHPHNNADA